MNFKTPFYILIKSIFSLILLVCVNSLYAQETEIFADKNIHFKNGLLLIEEEKFLAAQEEFELLYNQNMKADDNDAYILKMYASYYYAFSSYKLELPNAERLYKNFINNYHNSFLRNKAYFDLGNLYFDKNKTMDAIKSFEKIDVNSLSKEEKHAYKFKLGYAYFKRKQLDKALPLFRDIKNFPGKYYEPANYYYAFISFYEEDYKEAEKSFNLLKESNLYKEVVPYYLVQIYFLKGEYKRTIDYATPLLNKRIDNELEIKHIIGQSHFELQEYEMAVPLLAEYIQNTKKVTKEELYQLAYAQYKTGNCTDAVANFKQLNVVEDSLGQNAMYALADCYLKLDEKSLARDAFQKASRLNFDPVIQKNALFNYAKLSLELDFTNIAIKSLTDFLNNHPNSEYQNEAGELLSIALVQTKNYSKAIEIIENFKISGAKADETYQLVTFYRAIELYNDRKFDNALNLVNKSLSKSGNNDIYGLAIFLKANIFYEKENFSNAISNFSQFKLLNIKDKSSLPWASKSLADYYIAYSYFNQKKYSNASTYFEEVIKNSDFKNEIRILQDAYLRNADCLFMTRNFRRATDNYNVVIDNKWLGSDYALIQKSIIYSLTDNEESRINALLLLIKDFPNSIYTPEASLELGNAYLSSGKLNLAVKQYESFVQKYPNNSLLVTAYLQLGLAYFNLNNENKSLDNYKKVVKNFPNTDEAKQAITALKEIYVNAGRASEYIAFVEKEVGMNMSATEQDSLLFKTSERQYNAGNCQKAIDGFNEYLELFPTGSFAVNAYYFRAECQFNAKNYTKAFSDYKSVIAAGSNRHYENSLLKATYIAYEINKNYQEANFLYSDLYQSATLKRNVEIAAIGLMRTFYRLKKYDDVIAYSEEVINDPEIQDEVKKEAIYYKAKSFFEQGKWNDSKQYFQEIVDKYPISSIKAESAYHLALILFKNKQFQKSIDACFAFNSEYASYEYWIVKNFILIADNYYKLDNLFQAKATLQSIIDNYKGDENLINEAKQKLEKIEKEDIEKSKIDFQEELIDTLEFQNNN